VINDTNLTAACLVEYVNKVEKKELTSLEEMKTHMAKEPWVTTGQMMETLVKPNTMMKMP
jgi:hypothetical protein